MADNTETNQQAVQPTATQVISNINTGSITLEEADIYGKMTKFGELQPYRDGTRMEGQKFCLFRYGGAAFPCTEEFTKAFLAHELASVTLTGRGYEREVADPSNAGQKKTVNSQSYTVDGYLTLDDYRKAKNVKLKMKKTDLDIQRAEKAMEAKAAKDLSKEMTDEELEKLMELA